MNSPTSEKDVPVPKQVAVRELVEAPGLASSLRLAAGADGLDRKITHPRVQKSGLVLVGHTQGLVPTRVQVWGETELSYLERLDASAQRHRLKTLFEAKLSLIVVTRGVAPPTELVEGARRSDTPLAVASARSSSTINLLHQTLDRLLAPEEMRHGVLVDIHGLGTLLVGPSGIGKSECALFLVERGHRLVADDQVILTLRPTGQVVGRPAPLLRHHLEVRGIGILNVRDLFGATAVREDAVVDLVVELCPWRDDEDYDRLGLDDLGDAIFQVQIPMLRIPVRPGRDMAVILEVAARNQLLKRAGHHAARRFARHLADALGLPESE